MSRDLDEPDELTDVEMGGGFGAADAVDPEPGG